MSGPIIAAITGALVLVTICLATIAILVKRKRLRDQLSADELRRHEACVQADKAVSAAKSQHQRAVRAAEKVLKKAQTPAKVAEVGWNNHVTAVDVRLKGTTRPLTPHVVATLDQTGDIHAFVTQRRTFTRIAGGALIGGAMLSPLGGAIVGGAVKKTEKHKVDTREIYLMVAAEEWQEVVRVDSQQGEKARAMTQAINVGAQNSVKAREQHGADIANATEALERAIADTHAIEAAIAARQVLGEDPLTALKSGQRTPTPAQSTSTTPGSMTTLGNDVGPTDGPQDVLR